MLSVSGTGDQGTTGLLGGGRVRKDDARIEAYGAVDEASSALGLAKALTQVQRVKSVCEDVQRGLYRLGAELATNPQQDAVFAQITQHDVDDVERVISELEGAVSMPTGFVLPGVTPGSGALDVARTVTRRAERRAVELSASGSFRNEQALRYLNRVSLLLFVLARFEEHETGVTAKPAKRPGAD